MFFQKSSKLVLQQYPMPDFSELFQNTLIKHGKAWTNVLFLIERRHTSVRPVLLNKLYIFDQ